MRARRTTATIALASIILAACGPGDTGAPAAQSDSDPAQPTAGQPADEQPQPADATDEDDDAADETADGDAAALPPADEGTDSEPAGDATDTDTAVDESTDAENEPEPEPADDPPSMAWPDDGCSADNSPTPTDLADAPAPLLELRTESADSPLPDVAVRRLNCNGGWVNFRNEIPSELPLLVWFWAPH